jgi:hypothetical protein
MQGLRLSPNRQCRGETKAYGWGTDMNQVSTLPAFVRPSEVAVLRFSLSIPQFIGAGGLPRLKSGRSSDSPARFAADDLDEGVGSLELRLADNIAARQLAALLDVLDTVYSHALWVEQSERSEGAATRAEYRPSPDDLLWINLLEIGTPNKIKLSGKLGALTKVAGFLVALSGVLEASAGVEYAVANVINGFEAIQTTLHNAENGSGLRAADPQEGPVADAAGRTLLQARGALPAQVPQVHVEPPSKTIRPH